MKHKTYFAPYSKSGLYFKVCETHHVTVQKCVVFAMDAIRSECLSKLANRSNFFEAIKLTLRHEGEGLFEERIFEQQGEYEEDEAETTRLYHEAVNALLRIYPQILTIDPYMQSKGVRVLEAGVLYDDQVIENQKCPQCNNLMPVQAFENSLNKKTVVCSVCHREANSKAKGVGQK